MSQPQPFNRSFNFSNFQAQNPNAPLPAGPLDEEFSRVKAVLDQIRSSIKAIQRDDFAIANNSVGRDQLKPEVAVGLNPPTIWAGATNYVARDTVITGQIFYQCVTSHVSGVFATDLAAGKWSELADFTAVGTPSASLTSYDNLASGLAASNVQAAIDEVVSDVRPISTGGTGQTTVIGATDAFSTKGTAIASASTTDIGAATGRFVHITGTTTITGFGTKTAGVVRFLTFDGALTLTHNATSLILPGAANITTAAGDTAMMVSEGSGNWRCVGYQPAALPPKGNVLVLADNQTSGTEGGAFTSGADRTRVLNTSVRNTIVGAALASNQITLPAGVYRCRASAPAYTVDRHRAWLYDTTGAATLLDGTAENSNASTPSLTRSLLDGEFTLTVSSVLELRHRCQTTKTVNGLGIASSLGTEVYSRVVIERVG